MIIGRGDHALTIKVEKFIINGIIIVRLAEAFN